MRLTRNSDGSAKDAAPPGPLERLQECHVRIRHFMQLSRTLAETKDIPLVEITHAAAEIFRFFSHALPQHEADENESVFPRLRDALPQGGLVREAAEAMVEQHHAIEELVEELLSLCAPLSRRPEHLPVLAHRLQHVTSALDLVFAAHLLLEESVVFPAIPHLLTRAQLREMSCEMQRRRQPPIGTIHLVQ